MPIILATWEVEIGKFQATQGKNFGRLYLQNNQSRKGLLEWFKQ
jgi:hypothetical protein